MLTTLAVALTLVFAQADAATDKQFQNLGERFVESLRKEDARAYAACWVSFDMIKENLRTLNKPESEKQLGAFETYLADRDKKVAKSFTTLCDHFKKQGSLKDLQLIGIGSPTPPREKDGIRSVSTVRLMIGLGAARYVVDIDDGAELNGKWYFSDKPTSVHGPGKNDGASLRD